MGVVIRFAEVAVLHNVWWLEIKGKLSCKMLCPATTYVAYFVFKMNERRYYGFDIVAADETVAIVGGECCSSRVCMDPFLDNAPPKRRRRITCLRRNPLGNSMSRAKQPQERHDGWFEIELESFAIMLEMMKLSSFLRRLIAIILRVVSLFKG